MDWRNFAALFSRSQHIFLRKTEKVKKKHQKNDLFMNFIDQTSEITRDFNWVLFLFMFFCGRYGEIFKTNILGCPCVMLASAAAARFVLVTNAHLFRPTYPKSKETMIGPAALFFHQGNYHSNIRKLVQNSLCLGSLRNLVPHIETAAISAAESWAAAGHVINTFLEMKKVRNISQNKHEIIHNFI